MKNIEIGLIGERETKVVDELMAIRLGSGSVEVYGTPAMIALMEAAAIEAIDPHLPEGQASVGVALDVKHLAATPAGMQVRAKAEVSEVEGRKITFTVQAWDEKELIGKGRHVRYIIEVSRFVERAQSKRIR